MSLIQYSFIPFEACNDKIKEKIQRIQNNALRIILRVPKRTSTKLIHAIVDIKMINERIKEHFKYLDNAYNIDREIKQLIDTQDEQSTKKSLLTKKMNENYIELS
ncbi:hypothetical protein BpHYR1_021023 [Brachionus plicatilis]|uniref:RNA-directed DNA polymerase from mobile element jockey-like n=1 Tax=Brachionus plicatilis TaxID=10195 RepID=A0A3M7PFE0_BRAPC|nr:hypothetical protein BpHYR1_021023 [Brachionus plicatilis]